ncbi:MAG: DUF4097 family beta strand repeat protein [Acidimicrobiia bacterium]|nr:DUF4097 family beta strand repeat protein [Acidimicrobiia bacterium]
MDPIRITASSGRVHVVAESRGDIVIDQGQEHPMGGVLEVKGSSGGVRMRVPEGTDLVVGTHSGSVELGGRLGELRITTRSGRVEIDACAALDARSVSGRVDVGTVDGDCRIKTANGRITVGRVGGALNVASVSGRIDVTDVGGSARANSVSGSVHVGLTTAADARADSVSGSVTVELPQGVHPKASLISVSGGCICEVTEGEDCSVIGRSVSGRIRIRERR